MMRSTTASLLLVALLASSACQPADIGTPASPPQSPSPPSDSTAPVSAPATDLGYHCAGLDFTVRDEGDRITLQTPQQTYHLPQIDSADGAKFARDGATFWRKGDTTVVVLDGVSYADCRTQAAAVAAPPSP